MRIGSLFSGYGGLDLGVMAALGGDVAWHCESDPPAQAVLAVHWPEVPNLGDITSADWSTVEPVDVITGGFPCQDISQAGKREGITGARSGLWSYMVDAARVLRPRYVVAENVGALVVRGLDRVLADLAALGFDAEWTTVRASDVGAPHRRERLFLVATDAGRNTRAEDHEDRAIAARGGGAAADAARDGRHERRTGATGIVRRPDVAERGDDAAADSDDLGWQRELSARSRRPGPADGDRWGRYRPAVERWQRILGRPAPEPTEPGRNGDRLSPRFVEWLMGLPAGWVTDVPGVSRNAALRLLGNGVVPQQATAAIRHLVARDAIAA